MPSYELTEDAERDLREVALYTLSRWGKDALQQYRNGLKDTFETIATRDVPKRAFSERYPELLVTKYRHHYIFYLSKEQLNAVIIGVIHEKRDVVSQLSERLN